MPERVLRVNRSIAIPLDEIQMRATRAGGPGGQHVNKTATRVEAVWNVVRSPSLPGDARALLLERLGARVDADGDIRVVAADHRSQLRNREAALDRLATLLARNLVVGKKRTPTRPTRASRERRIAEKKRRGDTKRDRQRPARND
jgi:ribosome-associated protein